MDTLPGYTGTATSFPERENPMSSDFNRPHLTRAAWCALIGLTLMLCASEQAIAQSTTFTTNTTIGANNAKYEGDDITVSGCTVTIDGAHQFKSLDVTSSVV